MSELNEDIIEILLQVQMDDLKDAKMLYNYAEELKDEHETILADKMLTRAKTRLQQYHDCKQFLLERMHHEHKNLWNVYSKYFDKEASDLKNKLEKL